MKKLLFLILSLQGFISFGDIDTIRYSSSYVTPKFRVDLLVGPYLMVDHTHYKSVFMKGTRLGYRADNGIGFQIEYLNGQQHDNEDELGTTHNATGHLTYHFIKDDNHYRKFSPYIYAGGGFFEFKDFSKDVLGVAFYAGGGCEYLTQHSLRIFTEGRYLNLSPLNLGGSHQLGIFWGVRARF